MLAKALLELRARAHPFIPRLDTRLALEGLSLAPRLRDDALASLVGLARHALEAPATLEVHQRRADSRYEEAEKPGLPVGHV